jgi:cobalt-zinc-cadmium efflux system outer membrane protein
VNGNQSVLSAISSEGQHTPGAERLPHLPPQAISAAPLPVYGQLDVPESLDDGPPNGITLDMAIDTLVQNNIDLRTKAFEIPKSRADVLTASLRSNPMVFATASSIPYGSYSIQRPGDNSYSATVIYPFDVSHKRLARTEVASRAHGVLEAQYQDAVRQEIDNLYSVYVDLVAARETVRYALASQTGLTALARIMDEQFRNSQVSQADLERILIQRDMAELGVEQAQQTLAQSRRNLALMLNVPRRLRATSCARSPWAPVPI